MITVKKQYQAGGKLYVELVEEGREYWRARAFVFRYVTTPDAWFAVKGKSSGPTGHRMLGRTTSKSEAIEIARNYIEGEIMARKARSERRKGSTQTSLFGGSTKSKPPSTKGAKWSRREGYKPVRVRVEGHTRTVYKKKQG